MSNCLLRRELSLILLVTPVNISAVETTGACKNWLTVSRAHSGHCAVKSAYLMGLGGIEQHAWIVSGSRHTGPVFHMEEFKCACLCELNCCMLSVG